MRVKTNLSSSKFALRCFGNSALPGHGETNFSVLSVEPGSGLPADVRECVETAGRLTESVDRFARLRVTYSFVPLARLWGFPERPEGPRNQVDICLQAMSIEPDSGVPWLLDLLHGKRNSLRRLRLRRLVFLRRNIPLRKELGAISALIVKKI